MKTAPGQVYAMHTAVRQGLPQNVQNSQRWHRERILSKAFAGRSRGIAEAPSWRFAAASHDIRMFNKESSRETRRTLLERQPVTYNYTKASDPRLQLRSTATPSIPQSATFLHRLRNAGIAAGDSDGLKMRKTILVFAMGLMTAAPMFWLGVYWLMGIHLSATLPLAFQIVSVATLLIYVATKSFAFFCYAQLSLFLFFPFVAQLSIGSFISASGVVLWGYSPLSVRCRCWARGLRCRGLSGI